MSTETKETEWDLVIEPQSKLFDLQLKKIWHYRDLLQLFVWRDFAAKYKQTILGPTWFFISPLFTTAVYLLVFSRIAGISTDGVPPVLFYLSGITLWNYFSNCLTGTSGTFVENAQLFGKVYFPRLVVPLSVVTSNLIQFGIQLLLFLCFFCYFWLFTDATISPNIYLLLFPFLVMLMGGLGLGFGTLISSVTYKYRDLTVLLQFGVQLLMYATPVIYPISTIPEKYKLYILLNPMTSVIEAFKYAFLGTGSFQWEWLGYSAGFMLFILIVGVSIFNRTERTFMDTV